VHQASTTGYLEVANDRFATCCHPRGMVVCGPLAQHDLTTRDTAGTTIVFQRQRSLIRIRCMSAGRPARRFDPTVSKNETDRPATASEKQRLRVTLGVDEPERGWCPLSRDPGAQTFAPRCSPADPGRGAQHRSGAEPAAEATRRSTSFWRAQRPRDDGVWSRASAARHCAPCFGEMQGTGAAHLWNPTETLRRPAVGEPLCANGSQTQIPQHACHREQPAFIRLTGSGADKQRRCLLVYSRALWFVQDFLSRHGCVLDSP
jgi:hypothetical protein